MRQLFLEPEMNRMGRGEKDTVFGAAWRRGSGGFAGAPERHQVQPAAVVEAALRAAVAALRQLVALRQEEGRTAQRAAVQEGEASVPQEFPQVGRRVRETRGRGGPAPPSAVHRQGWRADSPPPGRGEERGGRGKKD